MLLIKKAPFTSASIEIKNEINPNLAYHWDETHMNTYEKPYSCVFKVQG
jgi:hypothetical protein